ncbi:MAG: 3-deoxy-manno-octulosonate cytidylyltransferase [Planctomycetota bacterium]
MARVIIIPARLASQRFPAKLLRSDSGWPLLRHGYERCRQVPAVSRVVVAADGAEIADVVRDFGGECVLTDPALPSGTDRVAAAALALGLDPERDHVVNVQGDEPEIDPLAVDLVFRLLAARGDAAVATLATCRWDSAGFHDPNRVKVVIAEDGHALYFSRAAIPHRRDAGSGSSVRWHCHVGIYGFRAGALTAFTARGPSPLEEWERLEQLRFLEMGLRIEVGIVESAPAGIDTPDDYSLFLARWRKDGSAQ